jgi:hypothetical protein
MTKINDAELQKVKQNRDRVLQSSHNFSEFILSQTLLEQQIREAKVVFLESVDVESEYLQNLNKIYGEGLLDIETGEIQLPNGE